MMHGQSSKCPLVLRRIATVMPVGRPGPGFMVRGVGMGLGLALMALGGAVAPAAGDQLEGAAWSMTSTGAQEQGIRSLSGADGVTSATTRGGSPCLTPAAGPPRSNFLYFEVSSDRTGGTLDPVYAVVEYFDDSAGNSVMLEYDSTTGSTTAAKYKAAEEHTGGSLVGIGQWRSVTFSLQKPLFAHRQNVGADFRLYAGYLFVRSVRLTHTGPPAATLEDAFCRLTANGLETDGIQPLSGADGIVAATSRGGSPCFTDRAGTSPPSSYLYFDVDNSLVQGTLPPLYMAVEYFAEGDNGPPRLDYDSAYGNDVASKYLLTFDLALGRSSSADPWKTAVFRLDKPLFKNRQNLGADFRLYGVPMFVRSIRLTANEPPLGAGAAPGTWAVVSLPQEPGEVIQPQAVAVDAAGHLYVSDQGNGGRIQERDAQGNWSTLAAAGEAVGQVQRDVNGPLPLAVDGAGNLFVADQPDSGSDYRGRIQMRDALGNWMVIAPFGFALGQVAGPTALAADAAGNLYLAEFSSTGGRIQKRDALGNWSLLASHGTALGQVNSPSGLAVDAAGNLYVGDAGKGPGRVQERDARGNWSLVATQPASALAVDPAGDLYLLGGNLQRRDPQGHWSVIASAGPDPGGSAFLPTALAVDAGGSLYVADRWLGGRIRKRDLQGNWEAVAAVGTAPGQIYNPSATAVDPAGNLYVADGGPLGPGRLPAGGRLGRVQMRDTRGTWSVIASAGADLGQVTEPSALAVDGAGSLYVADATDDGWRIQKRDAQGSWSVMAPDGPIPLGGYADLVQGDPIGLAVDAAGSLTIADQSNAGQVRERDAQGNWSLLAPSGRATGQVTSPVALAVDAAGNLYVLDRSTNSRIQEWGARGIWSVLATTPTVDPTYPIDQVVNPTGLAADAASNLYVASSGPLYGRIQKRDAGGSWSLLASSGFGSAPGQVLWPSGLAVDAAGHVYVADTGNDRLQEFTPLPGP